jgi:hypothetical protein
MKVLLKRTMVRKRQVETAAMEWLGRAGKPSRMAAESLAK